MKRQLSDNVEKGRIAHHPLESDRSDGNNGAFIFSIGGARITVVISDGGGWDHVSVSCRKRCPTWDEMCTVKRMFFDPTEWVLEFHPPEADNISVHDYCLHLWRPQNQQIPTPPAWMVGPKD